jgi:hypothetical protein
MPSASWSDSAWFWCEFYNVLHRNICSNSSDIMIELCILPRVFCLLIWCMVLATCLGLQNLAYTSHVEGTANQNPVLKHFLGVHCIFFASFATSTCDFAIRLSLIHPIGGYNTAISSCESALDIWSLIHLAGAWGIGIPEQGESGVSSSSLLGRLHSHLRHQLVYTSVLYLFHVFLTLIIDFSI